MKLTIEQIEHIIEELGTNPNARLICEFDQDEDTIINDGTQFCVVDDYGRTSRYKKRAFISYLSKLHEDHSFVLVTETHIRL